MRSPDKMLVEVGEAVQVTSPGVRPSSAPPTGAAAMTPRTLPTLSRWRTSATRAPLTLVLLSRPQRLKVMVPLMVTGLRGLEAQDRILPPLASVNWVPGPGVTGPATESLT